MNEKERDIFDDLETLKVDVPEIERAPIRAIAQPARERRTEPFGMIPLGMAKHIGGVTSVVVHLAYQWAFCASDVKSQRL
jgi:hypothetical protein